MPDRTLSTDPRAVAARKRYHSNPERARRQHEEWRARNKQKQREYHLRHEYGLEAAEYDALAAAQGNRCAICRKDSPGRRKYWCVDHDHETGSVRGLLCGHCNSGIGLLGDTADGVRAALVYLAPAECGEEHY